MLSEKETKVLNETRLRNMKRRYARLSQHAELTKETLELKKEIDSLESAMT